MTRAYVIAIALVSGCVDATPDETAADKTQAASDADQLPEDGKADGFDVCAIAGWYGDGVCDRFCSNFDQDCPMGSPAPQGVHTKYPIVLHHGMAGGKSWILTYNGIAEALRADGNVVVQTQVPPFDSVEVRGRALAAQIDETLRTTGATKVNLIAHAMGGLDARYVITTLGYGDRIASLTTMSTPHRGAALADFGLKLPAGDFMLDAIALVLGSAVSDVGSDPHLRAAMEAMAEAKAPAFNARTPDDSRVYYQSWAGVSSMGGRADERQYVLGVCENKVANVLPGTFDRMRIEFIAFEKIVTHGYSQPSDGMVTVASAKWGNFMGCVPGDHSDEIGRMTTSRPNPRTSWDPQRFWRGVAFDLSAKGF